MLIELINFCLGWNNSWKKCGCVFILWPCFQALLICQPNGFPLWLREFKVNWTMLKFEQCFTTLLWLISLIILFSVLLSVMDRLTLEETNLAQLFWNVHQNVMQREIYLLMSQYENIEPSIDLCAVPAQGNQQVCLH